MAKGERKVTKNDDSSDDEQASDDDSDSWNILNFPWRENPQNEF